MNGTAKEMASLMRAASQMSTDNHGRYLAELLRWYRHTALRGPVEPVDSLDFLVALWRTPFASRPDELSALNEVGRWLEERLWEEPTMSAERLAWQIGWLRRTANTDEDRISKGPPPGRRDARPEAPSRAFGTRTKAIRDRREQVAKAPVKASAPGTAAGNHTASASGAAALLRTIDKNTASAKVPEALKAVPEGQQPAVAREILKKLDRKWVEARKDKPWAAELLAIASRG